MTLSFFYRPQMRRVITIIPHFPFYDQNPPPVRDFKLAIRDRDLLFEKFPFFGAGQYLLDISLIFAGNAMFRIVSVFDIAPLNALSQQHTDR